TSVCMRLLSLKTVLAAADLDPSSRPALESALALAESSGAAFHIAHVSDAADATAAIEAALERLDIPRNRAVIHHLTGDAARAIGALADNLGADALVLGPHR